MVQRFLQQTYLATAIGLGLVLVANAAQARPEIASGDRLLNTSVEGCLSLADQFIANLDIQSDKGAIDRTGYFEDGAFRIVCYAAGEASLAVVFASHDQSIDIATNFIQMTLDDLGEAQAHLTTDTRTSLATEP